MEVNYEKIFGVHSAFFYYGETHMLVNMVEYLKPAVKNNEMAYICTEENIYNQLIDMFSHTDLTYKPLQHYSTEKLISEHKSGDIEGLADAIDCILEEALKVGYNGIRIVQQVSNEIKKTSKKQFLLFDKDLSDAVECTNASALCLYDFKDYSSKQEIIDGTVFKTALDTHTHILSEFVFQKPEDLYSFSVR